ncbi:extracellular solute-binding protein [Paenibacillus sp. TRM 82003]|nr:extracellular solute-binding protein [Paenibacillus sp. TRM 82003]
MIELTFLTEFEQLQKLMAAKESFESKYPEVRVVIEQSTDHFESLRAYESDEAPDLIESGGWSLFNRKGMFVDLEPYVAATEGLEDRLFSGPMKVARHDGTLPGLPVDISLPLILYRKAMFDQAGLAYPTEDWTWGEFVELGRKLTIRNEQGVATQFGFGIGVDIEWFEPFVLRNGGRYVAPDGSTARGYVDSPETIDAFSKLIDAYRTAEMIRKPDEPSEAGELHVGFAMVMGYAWFAAGLVRAGIADQFGVVGLPRMPGGKSSNMVYMGGAGITSKSRHPEWAWKFMHHYLVECSSWMLPLTRTKASERGLTEHWLWSRYLEELERTEASGFYLSEKWNSSRQLINEEITKMIVEGKDVAQTLRGWTRFA